MTPPKPPRTKYSSFQSIISSYEAPQSTYEDLDAPTPAVTSGNQPEGEVRPVPRPRSKIQPKSQSNNNNNNNTTADSAETTNNTTNTTNGESSPLRESPEDRKPPRPEDIKPPRPEDIKPPRPEDIKPPRPENIKPPRPARRPPKPPNKCMTVSKLDRGNHYMSATSEPNPPAVIPERTDSSPVRPERPPLPSTYYHSPRSTMRPKSESNTDESQPSRCSDISSTQQPPVSPAVSEEEGNHCGTDRTTAADVTDKPVVPPRLSFCRAAASVCETWPPQTRPPPPSFTPPPPPFQPSTGTLSDPMYSEIEHRPYLDVLPEDEDTMTLGTPTLRFKTGCYSSHQQTTDDTEDVNGLLRWLKKVSKPDNMAPSVYGVSIEEEIRSFNQRAMNVKKALRLYNLLMMKRNETLRNIITEFSSISDTLDKMVKKGKTVDIAGGTTGAVGGVTAVLGIALAPVTFGTSLIATVVGAGMVASAGGVGVHNAKAQKNIVNRMEVERLVYEYKVNVADLEHCLSFILAGMNELRRHNIARIQRAGAQPDALKMAHQSQFVFNMTNDRRTSVPHTAGMSSERLLLAFDKEMDQYFKGKDDLMLRNSKKSMFSGRVRLLAENLQDELSYLNRMWEMFG